jgi:hypothetical protein
VRFLGPGDQAIINGAIARARAAGVPETAIQGVIDQEAAHRYGFRPGVIAGRLGALTRQYQQPVPQGESHGDQGPAPDA